MPALHGRLETESAMIISSAMAPVAHLGAAVSRPSRTTDAAGCLLCQARRIKCDQTKPACLRCQKIDISCPGYPAAVKTPAPRHSRNRSTGKDGGPLVKKRQGTDFGIWRDSVSFYLYADKTVKKYDAYATRLTTMPVGPSLLQDSSFTFMVPTPAGAIPAKITMPVEEQAERYFLEHFVTVPTHPGDRGSNSFVPRFLKLPDHEQIPCFTSAFRAASLAALATRPSARSLRALAQLEYVRAIRAVGEAVQGLSREVGSSTQTLGSILLLSLYETLACPSQRLDAFEAHVKGALQLIMLLGMEELQSQDSQEMVVLARGRMLMLKTLPGYETVHTSSLANSIISVSYRDSLGQLGVWFASLCWRRDEMVRIIESGQRGPEVITQVHHLKDGTGKVALRFFEAAMDVENGRPLDEIFAKYGPYLQALIPRTDPRNTPPADSSYVPSGSGRSNSSNSSSGSGSGGGFFDSPDAASTPSSAASSNGSTIEMECEHLPRPLTFRDHREASFYLSSMVASLVIQNTVIRCIAWLHMDDDAGAYEHTPEYLEAAELASRAVAGIVASVTYYKRSLLANDIESLGNHVAPSFNVISMLSAFYSALMSQFATPAQREFLRKELGVMADEGGIAQISVFLANQSVVIPKDDIDRDRKQFKYPRNNPNFCTKDQAQR